MILTRIKNKVILLRVKYILRNSQTKNNFTKYERCSELYSEFNFKTLSIPFDCRMCDKL